MELQAFMAKVKQIVESAGGKFVSIKTMPAIPRLILRDQATGAVRIAQDRRLDDFARGRFGNS